MVLKFDWDKLRIFRIIAELGSLTKAAEVLNIHPSALSRSVAQLEESLKASLFHRHSRGLTLTEEGQILFQTAQSIVHHLNHAEASIISKNEKIAGEVVLTSTESIGSKWIINITNKFIVDNPFVSLRIILDDDKLDLGMREADIAIRLTKPNEPNLIAKYLGNINFGLFASQAYINNNFLPQSIEDLAKLRLIVYASVQQQSSYSMDISKNPDIKKLSFNLPHIRFNTLDAIINAVSQNTGLASLPLLPHNHPTSFVRILPSFITAEFPVYVVFDRDLLSYKIIQFLKNHIAKEFAFTQKNKYNSTQEDH